MPTSRPPRDVGAQTGSVDPSRALLVVAGVLVVAQAAFRAWALYPSWFYLDDYNLLNDALAEPLSAASLAAPYNGHLMPGGRLAAELVVAAGPLDWVVAASLVLLLQVAAGAACCWMLVTLFGRTPAVLALLLVYLTSALAAPSVQWWVAALNQVPMQLSFFLAVGAGVRYLRDGRLRWLGLALLAVLLGLFFWQKAVLVLPVLGALGLGWFAEGGPVARVGSLLRARWPAVLACAALGAGYAAAYLTRVSQVAGEAGTSDSGALVENLVGTSFATGILGGPWRWSDVPAPAVSVDPPPWATQLAWAVLAAVVVYGWLRRERTLRAWLLLAGYLAAAVGLVIWGRGNAFGPGLGLELRYLADVLPVAVLCAGLAFLPLHGAVGSSRPRAEPLLTRPLPRAVPIALVLAVAVSGVVSSAAYARVWHTSNASDAYLETLSSDLAAYGRIDVADTAVPDDVMSSLNAPRNKVSSFAPLVGDGALQFPETTGTLGVVAADGGIRRASLELGVRSQPGPQESCGWLVTERGRVIPLTGQAFQWTWWIRIAYLAGASSTVRIVAGGSQVTTEVQAGLHDLFVRVDGTFDDVRILDLEEGATMCVDTVEVGQAVPGGAWE